MFNLASVMELTLFDGRKYTMGTTGLVPEPAIPLNFQH